MQIALPVVTAGDMYLLHPSVNLTPTSSQKKEKTNVITSSTQQCGLAGKRNDQET
jgi:hypothetical protein